MKTSKLGAEAVKIETGGTVMLGFPRLADSKVLSHAISTRVGGVSQGTHGSLNVSFKVSDDPLRVEENRELLSRATGMDLKKAVWVDQIHGDKILKLDAKNSPKGGTLGEADGLITQTAGVPIMIQVADCLPVLFYDPIHKAIGLAHAGWRGTVTHVAAKTLLAMGENYGTRPEEVRAALGPCIGPCCFEVGEDVRIQFADVFPWAAEVMEGSTKDHWKLNLSEANARQLIEVGVKKENLIRSELCTIQNIDLFYSHRAEASAKKQTGRMGVFMMLEN